jgi:hypothetical protein
LEGEGGKSRSLSHAFIGPTLIGAGTLLIHLPSLTGAIDAAIRPAIS